MGHAMMASSRKARYQAPMTAARFLQKRCHARWPGVARTSEFGVRSSELASLIFHAWVEQGVGEIHHQIQPNEQRRIEQRKAHHEGVIAVQRAVDQKNANPGNLENVL